MQSLGGCSANRYYQKLGFQKTIGAFGTASWAGVPKLGGMYPPNNLTAAPPIIWLWYASASPPIVWLWSASGRWIIFGLFLVFTWLREQKLFKFRWRPFFCLFLICLRKKTVFELHPPMLKIVQNWDKIANNPPNAQHKSAPLLLNFLFWLYVDVT